MATNWSNYQQDVFNFVANGKGNAVISAVAGSGKTTTIVECAKRIPKNKSVLFLAFNKSIATELSQRLSPYRNINCATLHSHGFKAILKGYGNVNVHYTKYFDYINNNIEVLSTTISNDTEENEKRAYILNVANLFDKCRINLIKSTDLQGIEQVAEHHVIDLMADEIKAVSLLLTSAYNLNNNKIDFTDMLTLACTKFSRFVEKYDFVFIDECQDLSKAQRELMLLSLKPNGRFIAVGDRNQAINGFAGAGCDSFDLLSELANHNELPLSVNYRCGSDIINLAQDIVPTITAFEGNAKGAVCHVTDLEKLQKGDMILCRKEAPLIRLCLKLLANGILANVKGKDMGANLINLIKRLNPKTINSLFAKLDIELNKITQRQIAKGKKDAENSTAVNSFKDKIECLQAFAENATSIANLKANIEKVFSDIKNNKAIQLSTIHKAKGLEADNVFIVVPNKLPLTWKGQKEWQYQQELNLKYVAITRAKKNLYFVDLDETALSKIDF